jgi:hypothetical protein
MVGDETTVFYKMLSVDNLTDNQLALIYACTHKGLSVSEAMRGGGSRVALGRYLDELFGQHIPWIEVPFCSDDADESVDDAVMLYDDANFDATIVREAHDLCVKAPYINDSDGPNSAERLEGLFETWHTRLTQQHTLTQRKQAALTKLFALQPTLQRRLLDLTLEDVLPPTS